MIHPQIDRRDTFLTKNMKEYDTNLSSNTKSGLPAPSVVRMKLFTLDHRLVLSTIGVLSPEDQQAVRKTLSRLLHDT